jgi:hypothetical protein
MITNNLQDMLDDVKTNLSYSVDQLAKAKKTLVRNGYDIDRETAEWVSDTIGNALTALGADTINYFEEDIK